MAQHQKTGHTPRTSTSNAIQHGAYEPQHQATAAAPPPSLGLGQVHLVPATHRSKRTALARLY
jgi:hypothetical protein